MSRNLCSSRNRRLSQHSETSISFRSGLALAVMIMIVVFSVSYNSILKVLDEQKLMLVAQQTTITALRDEHKFPIWISPGSDDYDRGFQCFLQFNLEGAR